MHASKQLNRRAHKRFRPLPMYTTVTASRGASQLDGHVYDISESGVRIELDEPLTPGESVGLRFRLPGAHFRVEASASVVWVADVEDDPGPRRIALRFIEFPDRTNLDRLISYLDGGVARRAA